MANNGKEKIAEDRRDFLKIAGLGSVAGGAALAAGGSTEAEAAETDQKSGYRESGHVKTYYDLARF